MIYGSYKKIPELQGLPAPEQRKIFRAAYRKAFGDWQTWAAIINWAALTIVGGLLGQTGIARSIGHAIGAAAGCFIWGQTVMEQARRHMQEVQ